MKPIVSIVIPVFNVEKYLKQCLDSVTQGLPQNFEVILVDDGSTDSSLQICEEYSQKYNNVITYSKKNGGLSSARNYGLSKASGEWVWFIDSDDRIESTALIFLDVLFHKYAPDILIFEYYTFNKSIPKVDNKFLYKKLSKNRAMNTLLEDNYSTFAWNKVFKKKLFENIKFPEGKNYEDLAIMYKLYDSAQNFFISKDKLYGYRQRASSITNTKNIKNIKDAAMARYKMLSFLKDKYPINVKKLHKETLISIISYTHRADKTKEIPLFVNFLNKTKIDRKELGIRYSIEIFSFKYCKPIFYLIGIVGKCYRELQQKSRK